MAGGRAFRYVHGTGVSSIPYLPDGTWNKALAVSSNGSLTLVGGDSPSAPNGELYLYNATTLTTTALGSPNTAWKPMNSPARMTNDGLVVAVMYVALNNSSLNRYPYFRNTHGWFHLASALGAGGVNLALEDWAMEDATVYGISPDGTLVWGQAWHDSNQEGFVAEFPAGFLADFNPQPVAPSRTSIVGAWLFPGPTIASPVVLVMRTDGTYFEIEADIPAGDLDPPTASNADFIPGMRRPARPRSTRLRMAMASPAFPAPAESNIFGAEIVSDSLTLRADGCPDPECTLGPATRITGGAGSIVGGWFADDPGFSNHSIVMVMLEDLRDSLSAGRRSRHLRSCRHRARHVHVGLDEWRIPRARRHDWAVGVLGEPAPDAAWSRRTHVHLQRWRRYDVHAGRRCRRGEAGDYKRNDSHDRHQCSVQLHDHRELRRISVHCDRPSVGTDDQRWHWRHFWNTHCCWFVPGQSHSCEYAQPWNRYPLARRRQHGGGDQRELYCQAFLRESVR